MYTMQTGTEMTKLKGKKKGLFRFFYLDEHKSCIRWRPSKKQDKAKSESSASLTSRQACVCACVCVVTTVPTVDLEPGCSTHWLSSVSGWWFWLH